MTPYLQQEARDFCVAIAQRLENTPLSEQEALARLNRIVGNMKPAGKLAVQAELQAIRAYRRGKILSTIA